MASSRRERELARLRAERQAARRAEALARRKRRNTIVASTVAVLLVVGAATFLTLRRDGSDDTAAKPSGPCTYTASGEASRPVELPSATPTDTGPVDVTMTTDQGVVALTLDGAAAPCTTNAIVSLASQKFYDGTPCHRLTSGGLNVLQCGDPSGTGSGGSGYSYAEEALEGATYPAGTVAMANTGQPASTGSQFFLVYADSQLDPAYTPVGKITAGLDVLQKVAAAGSDPEGDGKPKLPITIQTFTTAAAAAPVPVDPAAPSADPAVPLPSATP